MKRFFTVPEGRHLVLPLALLPAPGATHTRVKGGEVIELDDEDPRYGAHQRFIANRIKVGDLVEVDEKRAASSPKAGPNIPTAAPAKAPVLEVNPPAAPAPNGGK